MASQLEIAINNQDVALFILQQTEKLAGTAENDQAARALFRIRFRVLNKHYDDFRKTHLALMPLLTPDQF